MSKRISIGRLFLQAQFLYGGISLVHLEAIRRAIPVYPPWLMALFLLGIAPFKLLLHEIGHYVAGLLTGFQIQEFDVGPADWTRLADGWHFRWMQELGYSSGFVRIAPVSRDNMRLRLTFFYSGGALAEVLSGCLTLLLFLESPALGLAQFGLPLGLWAVATLCAPLFAIATDGPPLRALFAGGKASADLCNGCLPLTSWATELRPKDWPQDWRPSILKSYYQELDRGELDAAEEQLNKAIRDRFWWEYRLVCFEAAYFAARHDELGTARTWMDQIKTGSLVERFVELRAEAAIFYAERNFSAAGERITQGLRLIKTCAPTGWTLMNADLLRDLSDRCQIAKELAGPEQADKPLIAETSRHQPSNPEAATPK